MSISRTNEDKKNNTGKMFIAKNRFGQDGLIFPMKIDTSCVSLKVMKQIDNSIEELEALVIKKQFKNLKIKYQEFKEKQLE